MMHNLIFLDNQEHMLVTKRCEDLKPLKQHKLILKSTSCLKTKTNYKKFRLKSIKIPKTKPIITN